MVSIHKVPVIVYLIIRVISSTFRFKRGVLHCRSLLALRSFHGTFVIGTNNKRRPTQFVYINNPAVPKVAIGVRVHQWP